MVCVKIYTFDCSIQIYFNLIGIIYSDKYEAILIDILLFIYQAQLLRENTKEVSIELHFLALNLCNSNSVGQLYCCF